MGKKKSFIDKKNAQTFSLVFRSAENEEELTHERVFVPQGAPDEAGPGPGPGGPQRPPTDPRELYEHFFGGDEEDDEMDGGGAGGGRARAPLPDARRRELLEYGFPDDGYDYLQHCRVIGQGSARMEGAPAAPAAASRGEASTSAGGGRGDEQQQQQQQPSRTVFLKAPKLRAPEADVKLVDARRLRVAAAAATVPAAAPGGVAASRQLGGRLAAEIAEVEEMMVAAEAAGGGAEGEEALGDDDFFDDFVCRAAAAGGDGEGEGEVEGGGAPAGAGTAAAEGKEAGLSSEGEEEDEDEEEDDEYEEFSSDLEADEQQHQQQQRQQQQQQQQQWQRQQAPGAQAAGLAALDDQFDNLMSAYDEDELGDLEDDPRAAGSRDLGSFRAVLGAGGARGPGGGGGEGAAVEGYGVALPPSGAAKVATLDDRDEEAVGAVRARIAAQDARAAARAEAAAAAVGGGEDEEEEDGGGGRGAAARGGRAAVEEAAAAARREQWDCESILMVRSNMSYAPARIASEPARSRAGGEQRQQQQQPGGGAAGLIKLNARTGLPSGVNVGGRQGRLDEGSEEEDEGDEGDEGEEGSEGAPADAGAARPKGETADERRARKAAIKEAQREARANKKQLKGLFKKEAGRQRAQGAHAVRGTTIPIP